MALISIIVPVYNSEKYIRDTLRSLLAQTHKDIEILCINDGSTDSSGKIIEEMAAQDRRVKYILQENSGPATARNNGLDNATGEYVMFCDSDDRYEPVMCERMLGGLVRNGTDAVVCDYHALSSAYGPMLITEGNYRVTAQLMERMNVYLWNKIFKKEIIDRYGIRFPDGLKADDNLFVYAYLSCVENVSLTKERLYHYIQRNDSIMDQFNSDRVKIKDILDKLDIFKIWYELLARNNLFDQKKHIFWRVFHHDIIHLWPSVPDAWEDKFFARLKEVIAPFAQTVEGFELIGLLACLEHGRTRAAAESLNALTVRYAYLPNRQRHIDQGDLQPAFDGKAVPIILSSDDDFVPFLSATIESIIAHSSEKNRYDIVVLTEGISDVNRETLLTRMAPLSNFSLRFFHTGGLLRQHGCTDLYVSLHVKLASYYRLFIPEIFKNYTQKAIYLDADLVVRRDVAEFHAVDLQGKSVGAVRDYLVTMISRKNEWHFPGICDYARDTLGLESFADYFNAGVLLLDLPKLRQRNAMADFIAVAKKVRFFWDQDALNSVLKGDVHFLDNGWNHQCGNVDLVLWQHERPLSEIYILHYAGQDKPWIQPAARLSRIFWEYARKSPLAELINAIYTLHVSTWNQKRKLQKQKA